jgi:hypothetical protein
LSERYEEGEGLVTLPIICPEGLTKPHKNHQTAQSQEEFKPETSTKLRRTDRRSFYYEWEQTLAVSGGYVLSSKMTVFQQLNQYEAAATVEQTLVQWEIRSLQNGALRKSAFN